MEPLQDAPLGADMDALLGADMAVLDTVIRNHPVLGATTGALAAEMYTAMLEIAKLSRERTDELYDELVQFVG